MEGNPWPRRVIGGISVLAVNTVANVASAWLLALPPSEDRDRIVAIIWPLAIVGIVVIAVALMLAERPRPTAQKESVDRAERPPAPEPAELVQLRQEKAAVQRRMRASAYMDRVQYGRGIRGDYTVPNPTVHWRESPPDAWARTIAWADESLRLLRRDEPEHPEWAVEFAEPIDPIATADADWRTNIGTYLEIKAKRLERIAREIEMG